MKTTIKNLKFLPIFLIVLGYGITAYASELNQQLYQTAFPYIKYFLDRSLDQASGFPGLTRSFQLYLGGHTANEETVINYGAANYDQSILGRISLAGGSTRILDTYINYFKNIADPNNPVLNCNGNYYDANSTPIKYGPYRIIRISGRSEPDWWNTWDWIVDTGAAACLIVDAMEAYQQTQNIDYKNFALLLGDYILKLQDTDGGIRYGPRGMYHDPEPKSDFYWNLKSTEQNERLLYAFEALFEVTSDIKYSQASAKIKSWLKTMYDPTIHLYHSAATFNGSVWVKTDFNYIATDVMAFAPLDMMFQDSYFGSTQQQRDAEVDAMFSAIELRTAFFNSEGKPIFFRFSVSQTGDYGTVEFSSQMALAYLRTAQIYSTRLEETKTQEYLNKYNTLISSLENYFSTPADDPAAKVAPYASYLEGTVAGGVPTGTGYLTYNCGAALASAYYAFAKTGYMPFKLGGGIGIPSTSYTLNMKSMPWYQNTTYNSTGAAAAQMILNYQRQGAGASLLNQDEIYNYARSPAAFGPDLTPDEMDKALGHFDPYDSLVSNWSNGYDSYPDGNPYKGYNFTVDTYDPTANSNAFDEFLRDICHWMAFTATKEEWWKNGELAALPNTPAAVPIFGTYNHWITVKGYAASANPNPYPRTNPFYTPDFIVYGLWFKDPLISGIGKDTYKTAAECKSTYFLPLSTGDQYNGKFVQVAEPPVRKSRAHIKVPKPCEDLGNLQYIGITVKQENQNNLSLLKPSSTSLKSSPVNKICKLKRNWRDIVEPHLLSDLDVIGAFNGTKAGKCVFVKRIDLKGADYYLVPFGKNNKKGNFLISAVILLDAKDGHFREVSWTKTPEPFLQVDKNNAIWLIRKFILNNYFGQLKKLPKKPRTKYIQESNLLSLSYNKLLDYVNKAGSNLLWQPNSYSSSPYKPYWRIDINGYIWYVTQEGKIIPETELKVIIEEIKNNRTYLKKFFKK